MALSLFLFYRLKSCLGEGKSEILGELKAFFFSPKTTHPQALIGSFPLFIYQQMWQDFISFFLAS